MTEPLTVPGGFILTPEQLLTQREWSRDHNHAACFFQLMGDESGVLVMTVTDLFDKELPTMSVTDDAEYVTMMAWKNSRHWNCPVNVPIIYRDTEGNWDELLHREGYFGWFRSLETKDIDTALDRAVARHLLEQKVGQDH